MLRLATLAAVVVLLLGTGAATIGTRSVVHHQEERLLKERGAEIALILSTAFDSLQGSLGSLGTAARLPGDAAAAFATAAAPQLAGSPALTGIALLAPATGGFTVRLAAGPEFHRGDLVTGVRAQTLDAALRGSKLVSTPVLNQDGKRALGFALGAPFAPAGTVLYEESTVQTASQPPVRSAAFSEVDIALYASVPPRADQLVLSTAPGQRIRAGALDVPMPLGASKWTLALAARHPLVGSVTAKLPWLVLGGGLLGTLLIALAIELALRRRDYALVLVAERTGELRASLAELAATQHLLVRQERLAAVGQLAAAVGHELRNPLGVISNALYLIRAAVTDTADAKLQRHLGTAEREVGSATLIVSDLLEYARGRSPIIGPVDLPDLIDEALEVAAPSSGVHVSWVREPDIVPVAGDRDQLRQVLLNLISNADDAMPDGGDLAVLCSADDGHVQLSIADTGCGMDEQTRDRLFEPFFTTKARGIGLGMAVVERIVLGHGGSITVETAPGAGTTFVVRLPVLIEPTASRS